MHITSEHFGDLLEMRIAGRLDNEWAGHLNEAIDNAVRQGSHSVVLDLTGVTYLSSAGIGVLIRAHKQLQSIRGFFGVGTASPSVAEVIQLTGLSKMLLCDMEQIRRTRGSIRSTIQPMFRMVAKAGMAIELYDVEPDAALACEVVGDPERLAEGTYLESDCRPLEFASGSMGLGLGAFGRDFADCSNRFGEFLAVAGTAVQLPTSENSKPDYQVSLGDFVPQVQVAYGLRCTGGFRQLLRFESMEGERRTPLSSLVDQFLTLNETDLAGMVFVAESAGLIGTALKRSPALPSDSTTPKLTHPEIRRWLSFSPERAFPHSLALVVGVASRGDPMRNQAAPLAPLLRPLSPRAGLFGHFHAAVFSYRPFKKRALDMGETIGTLFESEELQGVLHLLHDDRDITGGGESEFVRGACWVSPITRLSRHDGS